LINGGAMKAGDRVKLIGIPPGIHDLEQLKTRSLLDKCLNQSFVVDGIESFPGVADRFARLDVGHILGEPSYMHTIWIEEGFLQIEPVT
jgi:hypothetical protein